MALKSQPQIYEQKMAKMAEYETQQRITKHRKKMGKHDKTRPKKRTTIHKTRQNITIHKTQQKIRKKQNT